MIIANSNNYNILIQELSDLVETLNKYISGLSNQPISVVDIATLVSAITAAIISGISIYVTIKCNKKNCDSNEKIAEQEQAAENKRASATIDANLTASARIEWIQNVRHATAELITACYKYMWSESDQQRVNMEIMLEKKSLYVLYFGPDDDESDEIKANNLYDKKTNKGKNDQLVKFVDELFNELRTYHSNHSAFENKSIKESIEKCERDKRKTIKDLQDFSEAMRIYEKIEWKRAKEGK